MTIPDAYLENSLFDNLSVREKTVLNSNASLMIFDQEEMFIKCDSLLFSIFYIYEGEVKLKDQQNRLCHLSGAKDFIGLRYLFNQNPVFFSAYGTKGTQVIQFEKNVFKQFVTTNSKFLVDVYNKSSENVSEMAKNLLGYKLHKISGALADFLLHYNEKDCLKFLTQKEISEILGYSREIVWKCMKEFAKDGYIELISGEIIILNIDALRSIKQFG